MDERTPQVGHISENAVVVASGNVGSRVQVDGWARITGNARVNGEARIQDHASVTGNAHALFRARIYGSAQVYGNARIYGEAQVYGKAEVYGGALVTMKPEIYGSARVHGEATVNGNARIFGTADISGNAVVRHNAEVFRPGHVVTIDCLMGEFTETVTVYRTVGGGHVVAAGCQTLTLDSDFPRIAREHGWGVPENWESLRDFLKSQVLSWPNDDPNQAL